MLHAIATLPQVLGRHAGYDIPYVVLQAGTVYRMMFVQASTMKWNNIGFNQSGCVMGLYSRDQAYLNAIPRLTQNIAMSAANRYGCVLDAIADTAALAPTLMH